MFRKLAGTFFSRGFSAGVNLGLLLVSAFYFGASGRGEISLFIANLAFIQLFVEVLNGSALVYMTSRAPLPHLVVVSLIWSLLVTGIGVPLLSLTGFIDTGYFYHLLFLSFIYSAFSSGLLLLQGQQLIRWHVIMTVLQSALQLAALLYLVLVLDQTDPEAWFPPMYVSYTAAIVCMMVIVGRQLGPVSWDGFFDSLKACFRSGLSAQLSNFLYFLTYRIVFYILVSYDPSKASLGVYSVGAAIMESVWLISFSLATILYPRIAHEQDKGKAAALSVDFFKVAVLLSIPATLILIGLPASVYTFLLGEEFRGVKDILYILAPGIFVFTSGKVLWNYFNGTGQFRQNNIATILGLIVNVSLAFLLISEDWLGPAAAVACSVAYAVITGYLVVRFHLETGISLKEMTPSRADVVRYRQHIVGFFRAGTSS